MKHIVNQFRRMFYDDGRNDKMFSYQEYKLKEAVKVLKQSTDAVVKASLNLQDALISKNPTSWDDSGSVH